MKSICAGPMPATPTTPGRWFATRFTCLTTATLLELTVSFSGTSTTMLCPSRLPAGPLGTNAASMPLIWRSRSAAARAWSVETRTSIGVGTRGHTVACKPLQGVVRVAVVCQRFRRGDAHLRGEEGADQREQDRQPGNG